MRHAVRTLFWAAAAVLLLAAESLAQTPLPSWNETPVKQAILDFVAEVTQPGGANFVPEEKRIAVFDMDGTLIPERPVPAALIPVLTELKETVAKKPLLGDKPAVAALLNGDREGLRAAGEQGINDIIAAATDGKTTEEFAARIRPLMEKTTHEKFGVPYIKAIYQPMAELIDHLEANGFSVWICSGSPILFTRAVSEQMFGIPPQRVMGSNVETELDERGGKTVLTFDDDIDHLNDKEGKPVTINLALGTRPIFVGGNEGGRGDIAMMRWSKDRDGPSFQLLINHDDAEREFAYREPDNYSLNAAARYGFQVVSMKNDWKTIVAP